MAFRREGGALIELHWELTTIEWLRRLTVLDTEALWRDAQPLELDRVKTLQLAPHDMLLHLCLHLAAHNYAHLVGYRAITQVLNHHRPFPWDVFLDRTTCFRLRAVCYFALEATATALGAPVPPDVLRALRPPRWQRWLMRRVADPRRGLTGEMGWTRERGYLVHLLVADRLSDVLRLMVWFFFPGWDWLAERYQTRGLLQTLAQVLLHPLRVLWEGSRALWCVMARGK